MKLSLDVGGPPCGNIRPADSMEHRLDVLFEIQAGTIVTTRAFQQPAVGMMRRFVIEPMALDAPVEPTAESALRFWGLLDRPDMNAAPVAND